MARSKKKVAEAAAPQQAVFTPVLSEFLYERHYFQPRVKKVSIPKYLWLLDDGKEPTENKVNMIERGQHQADPSRSVSHSLVMPDVEYFLEHGVPFPDEFDERTMESNPKWIAMYALIPATWAVFAKREGEVGVNDIIEEVVNLAGVGRDENGDIKKEVPLIIKDVLFDCATYGLTDVTVMNRAWKKMKFRMREDLSHLEVAGWWLELQDKLAAAGAARLAA